MYVVRDHYFLRQSTGKRDVGYAYALTIRFSTSRPVAHFSLDERRKDGWLVVCGKLVSSSKNNG